MKLRELPLVLAVVALCGCAQTYVMRLNNGVRITTPHKPKLKGATYYYKDAAGRENTIPSSRVVEIAPASMAQEEQKFTPPAAPKPKHWWQFWK